MTVFETNGFMSFRQKSTFIQYTDLNANLRAEANEKKSEKIFIKRDLKFIWRDNGKSKR